MKKYLFGFVFMLSALSVSAQQKTKNLIIVTLDGMRWQEVFGGVDPALISDKRFTRDSSGTAHAFWNDTPSIRRKKLFPFLWSIVERNGQLYGNRWKDNKVNVTNRYQFSYPGYNEIFTGYPDTMINSNDKIPNPNTNVLEYLNRQAGFTGKVAAFSTWDVFPYILNTWRSGVYVNADVDTLRFPEPGLQLINHIQFLTARPIGVRPDVLTYFAAREYMKSYHPRALYIAFDETDDFAHGGMYDQYLKSAHAEDGMLADLWKYIQSDPQYQNNTTLIITCDHGRGDTVKATWRDHGQMIPESGQIWLAAIGPDTLPLGEMKTAGQMYQQQLAATFAALLGFDFTATHPVGKPIPTIYTK